MNKYAIKASSLNEAKDMAYENYGVTIVKNVTNKYISFESDLDAFAATFEDKLGEDEGVIVVLEPGVPDKRKRPYEVINNPTEGNIQKTRVFNLYDEDDALRGTYPTKGAALAAAKTMMSTIKQNITCKVEYIVDDAHANPFILKYVPSKNAHIGEYVVFGN